MIARVGRLIASILLFACSTVFGQAAKGPATAPARQPTPLERSVLEALSVDPSTAPYRIGTDIRDGQLVLSGRVATSAIHDLVIQTALAFTPRLRDDLVIDTAEAGRALVPNGANQTGGSNGARSAADLPINAFPGASTYSSPPYYYPPPLFGRVDEPFYGFEPPVISYPPWWPGLSRIRNEQSRAFAAQQGAEAAGPADPVRTIAATKGSVAQTRTIDLDLDESGVATLRGVVSNDEERNAVEAQVLATPGVVQVRNLLQVKGAAAIAVPPPPLPGLPVNPRIEVEPSVKLEPTAKPKAAPGPGKVPTTATMDIRDGVATLQGQAASLVDAMGLYLKAQRTEGVRRVDDKLIVALPNDRSPNPLLEEGDRADVADYLLAQVRRQVGNPAVVTRVELDGRRLVVKGRVESAAMRARVEAVLRSMPLLRGFDVKPDFSLEGAE